MQAYLVIGALLSLAATSVVAYDSHVYGADVSDPVSEADFRCLNSNNLTFVIIRVRRGPFIYFFFPLDLAIWLLGSCHERNHCSHGSCITTGF